MAPFGSVPAGSRRSSIDRPAPDSLPRFEGFGSTLGGFARSPQVSRAHPSLLRRENEPEGFVISENQTDFASGDSLTTPFLTSEAQATAERRQSSRPSSLLARSLGTFNEVFSRQVSLHEVPCKPASSLLLSIHCASAEEAGRTTAQWD